MHARVTSAAAAFEQRADTVGLRLSGEARKLAGLYQEVAAWFAGEASRHRIVDHTDRVFVRSPCSARAVGIDRGRLTFWVMPNVSRSMRASCDVPIGASRAASR